jgi:hypothetical protein
MPVPPLGLCPQRQLTISYGDQEEVIEAGDAHYLPPGHAGIQNEPGTELVRFSPTEELKEL